MKGDNYCGGKILNIQGGAEWQAVTGEKTALSTTTEHTKGIPGHSAQDCCSADLVSMCRQCAYMKF
jgi:hypothetical protein